MFGRRRLLSGLIVAAAIVVAAVLIVNFVLLGPSPAQASFTTLSVISGSAEIRGEGAAEFRPAEDGETLDIGDTVRTGPDSRALITFFEGSTLEMEPETEVTLERLEGEEEGGFFTRIGQSVGVTWHRVVEFTDPRSAYEVETPAAVAVVRGSLFQIGVGADGTTSADVIRGGLIVRGQGVERRVRAYMGTRVRPGEPPAEPFQSTLPPSTLELKLSSAALMLVVTPFSTAAGLLPPGYPINQEPGTTTTGPGEEPQIVLLRRVVDGTYEVFLFGVARGTYELDMVARVGDSIVCQRHIEGAIEERERWVLSIDIREEEGRILGCATTSPRLTGGAPKAVLVLRPSLLAGLWRTPVPFAAAPPPSPSPPPRPSPSPPPRPSPSPPPPPTPTVVPRALAVVTGPTVIPPSAFVAPPMPGSAPEDDDGDGVSDDDEIACGSDPLNAASTCEVCDGIDNDLNDGIDEGFPDSDGDGQADCVDTDDDTDDDNDGLSDDEEIACGSDPLNPKSTCEVCDGKDNDLDGAVDEGFTDTDNDGRADCVDTDDDGDGVSDADEIACGSDSLNPGSTCEVCDGKDNDLNDGIDEGFLDTDNDGQADCVDTDDDGDGISDADEIACGSSPLNPGSTCEVCDGKDNDLDGAVDEGFPDTDGDGKADCVDTQDGTGGVPGGVSDVDGDGVSGADEIACGSDPLNPKSTCEVCDGKDNDLNDGIDEGFPDTDNDGQADCVDTDDDGDGVSDADEIGCGSGPLNPKSTCEVCDGKDNDLNDGIDEGFTDTDNDGKADCVDSDDDGDGVSDDDEIACGSGPLNSKSTCEVCDGKDNDGDTLVDEDLPDSDGDGRSDCIDSDDDNDGLSDDDEIACGSDPLNSNSTCEVCDGIDNDGDTLVDEGFPDRDGDGDADCIDPALGEEQKDAVRNEILHGRTLAAPTSPEVLLIKDADPCGCAGNERALQELGVSYQRIGSSQIAATALGDFGVVIIASDQPTATYDELAANSGALANYVSGGGVLLAHAGDLAFNEGHWASSFLPAGVAHEHMYADELTIVQGTSPIVAGMTDEDLDWWGHSAQGYFTALPGNAQVVIGITGDPLGQPTYIEYAYGSGRVLATMQILEWPWCAPTAGAGNVDAAGFLFAGASDPLAGALALAAVAPMFAVIPVGRLWRRR